MAATGAGKDLVAALRGAHDWRLSYREEAEVLAGRSRVNARAAARTQLREESGGRLTEVSTSAYHAVARWDPPRGFAKRHPVPMDIFGIIAASSGAGANHDQIGTAMAKRWGEEWAAVDENGRLLKANCIEVHISNTLRPAGAPIETRDYLAIRSTSPTGSVTTPSTSPYIYRAGPDSPSVPALRCTGTIKEST